MPKMPRPQPSKKGKWGAMPAAEQSGKKRKAGTGRGHGLAGTVDESPPQFMPPPAPPTAPPSPASPARDADGRTPVTLTAAPKVFDGMSGSFDDDEFMALEVPWVAWEALEAPWVDSWRPWLLPSLHLELPQVVSMEVSWVMEWVHSMFPSMEAMKARKGRHKMIFELCFVLCLNYDFVICLNYVSCLCELRL
ncbi:uncharacterized protein LOC106865813 [Brachypodium distachyon]|uniref:Uncharacterized protein n=1 Tax=Brachypodium distachyon TaxID=15368 RepID=A0A2K2DPU5_BRADI|nr:uncharacterized protein LOC106865813 [Brachypodium distachyon]PNT76306.1 hypothetical protein BRADI_1g46891v3 [Brachypodium distachyon]|eukprot:XP_014752120.1 uncharacterized protein LOC106865813 [Brachypodium distachyon]